MNPFKSFIETQFPVSKLSKESYKERKAGASQTLTGLGKWWGRKPLILVRATILGLLMPASNDAEKDREIFLKILTMDDEGLWRRKFKNLTAKELYALSNDEQRHLYFVDGQAVWQKWVDKENKQELEKEVFNSLSYDDKLTYCLRPENIDGPSPEIWEEINAHLGTEASTLQELINQLGIKQFGHIPRVGDAFCGGGSIPFEAARIGCDAYASDLNPAAALLTWAALNVIGGGHEVQVEVQEAQEEAYTKTNNQIIEWGIEHNDKDWRADAYLYCIEVRSPASGYLVPLLPNLIISEKYNVCGNLIPNHAQKRYEVEIISGATKEQMDRARVGTVQNGELVCPEYPDQRFSISSLRGDRKVNKESVYGLRLWENDDLVPRPDDVFQERLYCIRYNETYYTRKVDGEVVEYSLAEAQELPNFQSLLEEGQLKEEQKRHFCAPDTKDLERENYVLQLLKERFSEWQNKGYIPSSEIPRDGQKTEEPIRTRGWSYWHHLFNPRQLLSLGLYMKYAMESEYSEQIKAGTLLSIGSAIDNYSRLCGWNAHVSKGPGTTRNVFFNQALNTQNYYGCRSVTGISEFLVRNIPRSATFSIATKVATQDARVVTQENDFWITDPPYADAINYHELADFFLSWYGKQINRLFPEWYSQSKSALAVKGKGQSFNESMVDCYSNFTQHMPDNGAQVVMFTHQDASVWADLALILWASGLQVTEAWTIQTETDAVGIKSGNYVQGTVCMVLRKQQSQEIAFLSDIQADVEYEVKEELQKMMALDDKEDPNFSDTDYQLAAYVAALRVITGYKSIEDIDVRYELSRVRKPGEVSEVQKIIDSAVAVACEYLVPTGFDSGVWRNLTGEERFYIKALEIQSHGEYRTGVFQELARGFGLRDYKPFLKSGRANETRLMTATEYGNKQLGGADFESSLVRHILFAIRETYKDDNPVSGRKWLKDQLPDYWSFRQRITKILAHIIRNCAHIPHWEKDVQAARLLNGYIENDSL